jgi:hypothetical protein
MVSNNDYAEDGLSLLFRQDFALPMLTASGCRSARSCSTSRIQACMHALFGCDVCIVYQRWTGEWATWDGASCDPDACSETKERRMQWASIEAITSLHWHHSSRCFQALTPMNASIKQRFYRITRIKATRVKIVPSAKSAFHNSVTCNQVQLTLFTPLHLHSAEIICQRSDQSSPKPTGNGKLPRIQDQF